MTTGQSRRAAQRQVAEWTDKRSEKGGQLWRRRTPTVPFVDSALRGLGLFVWRRPALHGTRESVSELS